MVMLSFVGVILVGSFCLATPLAQTSNQWGSYIDALFTATSATCVTGLVTLKNGIINELTFFGQFIVMICIQIGGLGFITIFAFIVTLFKKKLEFKDRYMLSQAVGSDSMSSLSIFVRKILIIAFSFELIGFLLSLPVMLLTYENSGDAVWTSLFHSVSAYNNAGFDLFGTSSFIKGASSPIVDKMPEWGYYYMLFVTMFLIVSGGISFVVVIETVTSKKHPKQWSAFTKIVLTMTFTLIIVGACLFMLTDGIKGEGSMTFIDALFQSVTLRTAGFASYDQANLSTAGRVISCFLMFTGAAPLSTGGGIKVTTMFLMMLSMVAYLSGHKVSAFKRYFNTKTVLKALSLMILAFMVISTTYIITGALEANNASIANKSDLLYESFSAFGTVGVSTGVTPNLSWGSKLVIIFEMYIGRLGPITFFQVFHKNINLEDTNNVKYIEEDCLIG